MLEKSENTILVQSILFAADSPAKTSPVLNGMHKGLQEKRVDCGVSTIESFASFDPDTYLLKTSQHCLMPGWIDSVVTLPPSGMMRNGKLYEHPRLDYRTLVTDYSLLPTPRVFNLNFLKVKLETAIRLCTQKRETFGFDLHLTFILKILGVPLSRYPNIYEWIMGFPLNYLKLKQQSKVTETPSHHQSQNGSVNK